MPRLTSLIRMTPWQFRSRGEFGFFGARVATRASAPRGLTLPGLGGDQMSSKLSMLLTVREVTFGVVADTRPAKAAKRTGKICSIVRFALLLRPLHLLQAFWRLGVGSGARICVAVTLIVDWGSGCSGSLVRRVHLGDLGGLFILS